MSSSKFPEKNQYYTTETKESRSFAACDKSHTMCSNAYAMQWENLMLTMGRGVHVQQITIIKQGKECSLNTFFFFPGNTGKAGFVSEIKTVIKMRGLKVKQSTINT